jgi:hypothetical protein
MVQDYNPRLSLRRVPVGDPGFNPERPYGVFEEVGPGVRPWVFFLSESMINERVLARLYENDLSKQGVDERMAKLIAFNAAQAKTQQAVVDETMAERQEQMLFLAKAGSRQSTVRLKVDGDDIIVADDPTNHRSPRTFITK